MNVCSHAWDSSRALKMNVDTKYVIVLGIGSAYQKIKKKRVDVAWKKENSTLKKRSEKNLGTSKM